MTIEQQRETSPKFKEIDWVSKQVKEELKRFNKEKFYDKNGEEIIYNMDTVKQYLWVLKDKKTWKELISKNSSAMVMAVQIALYSQNYSFWSIDWILWDKTKAAIRKFQENNNIPVDVYWRSLPSTIQKLLEVISREDQVEIPEEEQQEAQEIIEERENKDKTDNKPNEWDETEEIWNEEIKNNETKWEEDVIFYTPDENMEWVNAQEIIRPEIQELINNYSGNAEHFKNVKELTKAEAKAICNIRWIGVQYLYFSSLEKIHPSGLEELLKHHSWLELWLKTLTKEQTKKIEGFKYWIEFNNITSLDISIVESLAKTEGSLLFPVLKKLTPEIMNIFSNKISGNLVFKGVNTIDIQTAEMMLKYPWKIYLDGIKEVSLDVVKVFVQKPSKVYLRNLDGTKQLSTEVLDVLSNVPYLQLNTKVVDQIENYKKEKRIEGKQLTTPILELYNSGFNNMDSLKELKSISYDDAVLLAESWKSLDLSWIEEISEDIFEALMKTTGTITIGLENFPENLAKKVEGRSYWFEFTKLKNLDVKSAKYLAHCYWSLKLDALESITPEVAQELWFKWWPSSLISLNWIQEENPQVFEAFNNFAGSVLFNNISKISETSAKILEKKQNWKIFLHGLREPLPDELVPYLANNISHISTNPWGNIPKQLDKYRYPKKYKE